jgi:hypothetical protein
MDQSYDPSVILLILHPQNVSNLKSYDSVCFNEIKKADILFWESAFKNVIKLKVI